MTNLDALKRYAASRGITVTDMPMEEEEVVAKTAAETFSDVADNIASVYKSMTPEELEARIVSLSKGDTGIEACERVSDWATNPDTKAFLVGLYDKVIAKKAELEPKEEDK